MIKGIAHTAYVVSNMQATLRFYCEQLGLRHAFSIPDQSGKPWIEYVKVSEGQFVEFFHPKDGFTLQPGGGYLHLCLRVDDIHQTAKALEAAGISIRVQPQQGRDGNWQCWVDDPDGNAIEFMQISPDSPQARS